MLHQASDAALQHKIIEAKPHLILRGQISSMTLIWPFLVVYLSHLTIIWPIQPPEPKVCRILIATPIRLVASHIATPSVSPRCCSHIAHIFGALLSELVHHNCGLLAKTPQSSFLVFFFHGDHVGKIPVSATGVHRTNIFWRVFFKQTPPRMVPNFQWNIHGWYPTLGLGPATEIVKSVGNPFRVRWRTHDTVSICQEFEVDVSRPIFPTPPCLPQWGSTLQRRWIIVNLA